jgi:outer membrane protein TolC
MALYAATRRHLVRCVVLVPLASLVATGTRLSAQQSPAVRRLTLADAVAIAQSQGLAIQAAREARAAAMWNDRAFFDRLRPRVNLSGSALNFNHSINSITLPDGSQQYIGQSNNQSNAAITMSQDIPQTGGTISMSSTLARTDLFGNLNTQSWNATPVTFGISQPIFLPRTLLWNTREQVAVNAVAQRQYLEAREDVAVNAVSAFFGLYAAEVAVRNAAANAGVYDTLYRVNQQKYASAVVGQMDLGQSELQALTARIDLDNSQLVRDRAAATLHRLLNIPTGEAIEIVAPDVIPAFSADPDLAVSEAIRNGSAASQIELSALIAEQSVERARLSSGFSANLNASVGFNQTAPQLGSAYQSPLGKQQAFLSVSMPLLQWGAGSADVSSAKANQTRTSIDARMMRDQIAEDARFTALQVTQSTRALVLSAKADTLAAQQFALARSQYASGNILITALFLAQLGKDNAVVGHVQALRNFWTQYYALRRLTLYDFIGNRRLEE